jgi:hypothetical protein
MKQQLQIRLTSSQIASCLGRRNRFEATSKIITVLFFTLLLSTVFVLPVFCTEYHEGVKVGDYVTYGNFVGFGNAQFYDEYAWAKNEVTSISGDEVTLLSTGLLKDGTPIPENNISVVWNVATGQKDGLNSTEGPIIAANLNQGDALPPNLFILNRTENRVYLGVTRAVNIHEVTASTTAYTNSETYVYDRTTGLLLEVTVQSVLRSTAIASGFGFTVIDTNIFTPLSTPENTPLLTPPPTLTASPTPSAGVSSTPSPTSQPNQGISIPLEYAVAAVVVVIVFAAVLVLWTRKK